MKVKLFLYSVKVWALAIVLHLVFFFISIGYHEGGNIMDTISVILTFLVLGFFCSVPALIIFFLIVRAVEATIGSVWARKVVLIVALLLMVFATLEVMGGYPSVVHALETALVQTALIASAVAILYIKFPVETPQLPNE